LRVVVIVVVGTGPRPFPIIVGVIGIGRGRFTASFFISSFGQVPPPWDKRLERL